MCDSEIVTDRNFSEIMSYKIEQHWQAIGNFHLKGRKHKMESRIPSKTSNPNGNKWCILPLALLGILLLRAGVESNPGKHINKHTCHRETHVTETHITVTHIIGRHMSQRHMSQ